MFFKMSQKLKNDIKGLIDNEFSNVDFDNAVHTFENLINIKDENSDFNIEYGYKLEENDLCSPNWDVSSGCKIEGFLRKIENLKGNLTENMMLKEFYTRIGFYDWLNESDIKNAREKDAVNSGNAENRRGGEGFHLTGADATKYIGCPHHIDSYITTYQLRNKTKAHDFPADSSYVKRFQNIKSLFIVYLDQCIINSSLINNAYERELIDRIDYVKFASECMEDLISFNKEFLQLEWIDEQNGNFKYDYSMSVKLLGEAGIGKTTQMRKMYYNIIEQVKRNELKVLPIWINLSDLNDNNNSSIEEIIKNILGEYEQYYGLLLKNNVLMLFLDGYNEVLAKDEQEKVKRRLAADIDEIHKKYPDVFIAMTDRNKKSIPICLNKRIKIYSFKGLNRKETIEYVKIKTDGEITEKTLNYLESDKSDWLYEEILIPEKLNSLIDLISNDIIPNSTYNFYDNGYKIPESDDLINVLKFKV